MRFNPGKIRSPREQSFQEGTPHSRVLLFSLRVTFCKVLHFVSISEAKRVEGDVQQGLGVGLDQVRFIGNYK